MSDSPSVRTRRQAAAAAAAAAQKDSSSKSQAMNGHINGSAKMDSVSPPQPKENIFLFYPNLIGNLQPLPPTCPVADPTIS